VRNPATLRRCLAVGAAAILGAAALLPSSVSAHHATHSAAVSTEAHVGHPPTAEVKRDDTEHGGAGTGCSSSAHSASSEEGSARSVSGCGSSLTSETSATARLRPAVSSADRSTTADQSTQGADGAANGRSASVAGGAGSTVAVLGVPVGVAGVAPNSSTPSGAGSSATAPSSSPSGQRGSPGGSGTTRQPPAPVPSQPTVLGPVPLVVPAIGGVAGPAGGALPWAWFAALAAVDLGLTAGILVRRRRRRGAG
jgi:hypothetical protein